MSVSLNQYAKIYSTFENERTRPVFDLLAPLATRTIGNAIDLGCGPGNSTEVLQRFFPQATIAALDSSEDMIEKAQQRLPHVRFDVGSIQDWMPNEHYDLILANASLQWVPNHQQLYPHLMQQLSPTGALAVQTPDNLGEPAHELLKKLATSTQWRSQLSAVERLPRANAEWYFELLSAHSSQVMIWRTCYFHHLKGGIDDVVDWFRGSALRPYLLQLSERDQVQFLTQYKQALQDAYRVLDDGSVLLPFPRLFINALR